MIDRPTEVAPDPSPGARGRRPGHVGVVVRSLVVPAHLAEAVELLSAVTDCSVTVLVLDEPATTGRDPGRLFRWYRAIDRRLFRATRDPHRPTHLAVTPTIHLGAAHGASSTGTARTSAETVATVRDPELDVLLALTAAPIPPDVARLARRGVWRLRQVDEPGVFFRALQLGRSVVELRLTSGPPDMTGKPPEVLYRSVSPVDRYSVARTEGPALWKAAHFPARVVRAAAAAGWPADVALPPVAASTGVPDDDKEMPSTGRMIGFLARLGGRVARRVLERCLRRNDWFVAYRRRTPDAPPPTSLEGFRPIEPPPGTYYADPFVLAADGEHHLFVEVYSRATGLGSIGVMNLDDIAEGRPGPWPAAPVLTEPFHLSYPFVTRDRDGRLLLVPESGDHGVTRLYRSSGSPTRWDPAATILTGTHAYDPTIVSHGGRYWLFTAIAVPGANPWDELFLFSAPDPAGPWTPHPGNPVVSDARSARPAGRIFEHEGRLIRPAQDCSGSYGRRVVLQEILTLDPERYRERPWSVIEPAGLAGVRRTHCYTFDGAFEVVDGFRLRSRFAVPFRRR